MDSRIDRRVYGKLVDLPKHSQHSFESARAMGFASSGCDTSAAEPERVRVSVVAAASGWCLFFS